MKALVLEEYQTDYQLKEVEKPAPAPGQVLVKIAASGVNPLDLKIKAGQAAHAQTRLPAILGIDLAGTVEAVGEGVTTPPSGKGLTTLPSGEGATPFKPGDAVYGMTGGIAGIPGTLAEYAAVDARLLAIKPQNLDFREAAALPLVFITAWEALVDKARITAGQSVLIHGGAGGVGHIALQIARARGAKVYTTVSPKNKALAESYGAIPIDHTSLSVESYVQQHTSGEGFDIVLDNIGGKVLDDSFMAVKRYTGHVVSIQGFVNHNLGPLSFRNATYSGVFTLYPLIAEANSPLTPRTNSPLTPDSNSAPASGSHRAHYGEILRAATAMAESGQLKPLVEARHYSFDTINDAYHALRNRTVAGKLVIDVG